MSGSGLRSAGVRLSVEGANEAEAAFRRVGDAGDQSMGRVSSSAQRAATALREVRPAADSAAQSLSQVQQQGGGVNTAGANVADTIRSIATQARDLGTQVQGAATPLAGMTQALQSFLSSLGPAGAIAASAVGVAALAASFLSVGAAAQQTSEQIMAGFRAAQQQGEALGRTVGGLNDLLLTAGQRAANLANAQREGAIAEGRNQIMLLGSQQEAAVAQFTQAQTELARLERQRAELERSLDTASPRQRAGIQSDLREATSAEFSARSRFGAARSEMDRISNRVTELRTLTDRNASYRTGVDEYGPPAPERAAGGGGGGGIARRSQEEIDAERELNRALAERAAALRANESPYDTYLRQLRELAELQDRLPESERLTDDQVSASADRFLRTLQDAETQTRTLDNSGKLLGTAFASAFESAIVKGEEFSKVLQSLAEDLAKIALRKGITDPLGNAFSAATSGLGSSIGSFFTSLISGGAGGGVKAANGHAFSGGDLIPFANGGVFDAPTVFPMSRGRFGVMGEAGPEAIMPLERGANGRLGVRAAGGGGGGVTQVINIDARNADSGVDQKIRAAITIATQQANAQLLADISRGGSTAKQVGRRA